ncbi:chemotaxis-specific protein-glutamate methyltransferase CheB [Desulfotomaculum copahuensis]|uniref:Protein-glutamate methylesterase/protein-glutamine glutaminase n=1 Tax=Desulfotomaculum copahuensis TaxID=1838280 RepID=A0A1B7LCB2_9FIRM|nr:chemotaxis-specific protein-glutamate methyltransferase CheB [Desulfotomaculum copahuensis]OAT80369.1 chemotaxis response regulator protein-glutamate methylesterase [Desulfotomaculum copahuensis]
MGRIRVLVVDDSALMRRLISRLLEEGGLFKVIGTAVDGEEAVRKICELKPDVVSLDLEMPALDGLGVLRRVMRECPVPVVMLSSLTTEGARATMQALALGAVDFVPKPSAAGHLDEMTAELRVKLRTAAGVNVHRVLRGRWPKPAGSGMKGGRPGGVSNPRRSTAADAETDGGRPGGAFAPRRPAGPPAETDVGTPGGVSGPRRSAGAPVQTDGGRPAAASAPHRPGGASIEADGEWPAAEEAKRDTRPPLHVVSSRRARVDLVVIGCSTGGPAALQALIPALPAGFPAPVVVVQHIPAGFSGPLAEHLDRRSGLAVRHAAHGDLLVPGLVLVAPAGFELTFTGRPGAATVHLSPGDGPVPKGGFRPAVDAVMLAAVETFGARVMGVLLTGMGKDGAKGMAAIHAQGGPTIAEDESTCVVFGMPRAAMELGAVRVVVPLDRVAEEMVRLV